MSVYEFDENTHACLSCGGTGQVSEEIRYSNLYGNQIERRQVECPRCYGRGAVITYTYKTIN